MLSAQKLAEANISVSTLFNRELALNEDPIVEILSMETSSDSESELHVAVGGAPGLEEKQGDRPMSDLTADDFRLKNKKFWTGFKVDADKIADDKLAMIVLQIKVMAHKSGKHYGNLLGELLVAGFGTDLGKTMDGQAMFSAAHRDIGGGPLQSNMGTAGLSPTAVFAARANVQDYVDHQGNHAGVIPTHLVVGSANEELGREIVGANIVTNAAGTASKSNVHEGLTKLVVLPAFRGAFANHWGLACNSTPLRALILQIREAITMTPKNSSNDDNMFHSDYAMWGIQGRHAVGYGDWRSFWCSNGTT